MEPRAGTVRYALAGAFHGMAFTEWGDRAAPPLVCVHGLTRTGRDFDPLARDLSDRFWVVCPDLPGRGASDWLPDGALYQPASYVAALTHLLALIGRSVSWVGTSLGGICGMVVASMAGQPVTRMVLNDIGPHIPKAALARIKDYIGLLPDFDGLDGLEAHLRRVHAPFGRLTDAQWRHLATTSARVREDGRTVLHYDPRIAEPIQQSEPADVDLWPFWARITIPMLAVRGATSDLLLSETLNRMTSEGAQSYVVADAGHAPALMDPAQIEAIRGFLLPDG